MCVDIPNTVMEYDNNKTNKKISHWIKKLMRNIFKKQKSVKDIVTNCKPLFSKSLEYPMMAHAEREIGSMTEEHNIISISSCGSSITSEEQYFEAEVHVPVHFTRTEHGTFFWTATSFTPADADLIEPLYCCTDNQIAVQQPNDRWAQA